MDIKLKQIEILKALAHPVRLEILKILNEGALCAGKTNDMVPISQPNFSQHLKILRDAGLIERVCKGTRHCYYIAMPELVKSVLDNIEDALEIAAIDPGIIGQVGPDGISFPIHAMAGKAAHFGVYGFPRFNIRSPGQPVVVAQLAGDLGNEAAVCIQLCRSHDPRIEIVHYDLGDVLDGSRAPRDLNGSGVDLDQLHF